MVQSRLTAQVVALSFFLFFVPAVFAQTFLTADGSTDSYTLITNVLGAGAAHTYSVFVTPPGGVEQTVGANFAFRTEQNTATSLDHWGVYAATGSDTVCSFAVQ